MAKVEIPQQEMSFFQPDGSEFCRPQIVNEIKLLIDMLNNAETSEALTNRIKTAEQILIIGPGPFIPELDLFSTINLNTNGSTHLVIPDNKSIVLVERDGSEFLLPIHKLITQMPNIKIHQNKTISNYCETYQPPLFDLILYLRVEALRAGKRPESLGLYLQKLLNQNGLAVITGDQDGINRLVDNTVNTLTAISKLDNLPEGLYEGGGFDGHSGVILLKK